MSKEVICMSIVQEGLNKKGPAGLSLKERVTLGFPGAGEAAFDLLEQRPPAGLSAVEWRKLGLESAEKIVEEVHDLILHHS
jgi:hypothetical protein